MCTRKKVNEYFSFLVFRRKVFMKKILVTFIFVYSLIFTCAAAPGRLYTDEEIDFLKARLLTRLENNLSSYLGEIKYSVFLKLNTKAIEPQEKNTELLSLYMLDKQTIKEGVSTQTKFIEEAIVKIIIYEKLEGSVNKEIQDIVESTLEGQKVKVKISFKESTNSLLDKNIKSTKDLPNENESFFTKVYNKHLSEVIKLVGNLILGVSALFGVFIFARFLRTPLNTIAESVKSMSPVNSPNSSGDPKEITTSIVDYKETSEKFKENLGMFKEILLDNPSVVASLILKDEMNAAGIKKLLPYVYEKKYSDVIKEHFNETHFSTMEQSGKVFNDHVDFVLWFERTMEVLSLVVLNKHKNVLSAIPEIQMEIIKKIPSMLLRKYLDENRYSLTYQVVMDLLHGEEKREFLKTLDVEEWKIAFEVSDVSENEIKIEVEKIIQFSKTSMIEDDIVSAVQIQSSLIIPSLLSVISHKKLNTQDAFIESLSVVSDETVHLIKESFWTPRDLQLVPEAILQDQMRLNAADEKCMIIHSMPEDIAEFLINYSMDGKAREIVKSHLKNKNSDFNDEKSEVLGAKFIMDLFKLHKRGAYKLIEKSNVLDMKINDKSDIKAA